MHKIAVNNFLWRLIATTAVRYCLNWWSFSTGRGTGTCCSAMFPESSQCSLPSSCKGECEWELSVLTNQKIQTLALAQAPKEKKAWHNLFAFWSNRSLEEARSDEEHFDDILPLCFLWTNDKKEVLFRFSKNLVNFARENTTLRGPGADWALNI